MATMKSMQEGYQYCVSAFKHYKGKVSGVLIFRGGPQGGKAAEQRRYQEALQG